MKQGSVVYSLIEIGLVINLEKRRKPWTIYDGDNAGEDIHFSIRKNLTRSFGSSESKTEHYITIPY